ncbi:nucleotide exchange factor GrpE [Actinokineospora sp. HUAS TT18]|uniref:nucleotide exchange factor GrpE n=1 Tax=Actinokineospora sp. HUAS TT18 TaxID=3447451 RepID=UPI003F52732E
MTDQHNNPEGEEPRVVVRDRRRIDPDTGQVRTGSEEAEVPAPAGTHAPTEPEAVPEVDPAAEFKAQLDERTADLQRLQAEYANYRKRVDRDREVVATAAKGQVVTELLSVLDDIERAAAHGDLTGAFKAVAEKLAATLQKSGLEPFGHEGEPFDPSVHEAVQHNTSTEVDGPTVTGVLRRGYRFGDRVVRAALVAVTDAETPAAVVDGVVEAEQEEN